MDRGPLPDNADWPPATLEYVGATTAPIGTLWLVPTAYLRLLRTFPGNQSPEAVGVALATHLLELNPVLRDPDEPAVACATLVSGLADLAVRATNQRRQIYVLTHAENPQARTPSP